MSEKNEKVFVGIVTSDKASKTITVSVTSSRMHPIYKKQFNVTNKFLVHDEKEEAKPGDKVAIVSVAPMSKRKSFMLKKILEKAPIRFDETIEEEVAQVTASKASEKSDDGDNKESKE